MPVTHPETALVPYIRGELFGAERELVAAHLEGCEHCREAAESFRALLSELSSRIDELPVPHWGAYRSELRRKLEARKERRLKWWRPAYGWGAGLAIAAATAALALWLAVPGLRNPANQPPGDQLALEQQMDVTDVGFLRNYGVVQQLDLLENYDVIEHLDELRPMPKSGNAVRS
jgi:anti-sigma factor RsiW